MGTVGTRGEPWFGAGLRFECTQCGNCCRNLGEYTHVYLGERDVRAIAEHLGLSREAFLARYCREDSGWIVLRMDEPACPFLGPDRRCSIYPVRPKQCATWPFWKENLERSRWEGEISADCPGIGKGPLVPTAEIERLARETDAWLEDEALT
jgi:Fe-S-cluster containining protein